MNLDRMIVFNWVDQAVTLLESAVVIGEDTQTLTHAEYCRLLRLAGDLHDFREILKPDSRRDAETQGNPLNPSPLSASAPQRENSDSRRDAETQGNPLNPSPLSASAPQRENSSPDSRRDAETQSEEAAQ